MKKEIDKNNKIIMEIVVITLAVGFLLFMLLSSYTNLAYYVFFGVFIIVLLEILLMSSKKLADRFKGLSNKWPSIILFLLALSLLFTIFYQLFYNKNQSVTIYIIGIGAVVVLILLFINSLLKMKGIKKQEIGLLKGVVSALLSLVAFVIILISFIFIMITEKG